MSAVIRSILSEKILTCHLWDDTKVAASRVGNFAGALSFRVSGGVGDVNDPCPYQDLQQEIRRSEVHPCGRSLGGEKIGVARKLAAVAEDVDGAFGTD